MRTCDECGAVLRERQKRHCSKPCYMAEWHRKYRAAKGQLQSTAYRQEHGRNDRVHLVDCLRCGRRSLVTSPRGQFCSLECASLARRRPAELVRRETVDPRLTVTWLAAAARLATAARGGRSSCVWVEGPCQRCGGRFTAASTGSSVPRYCSPACKRRDVAARRKIRKRVAFVEDVSRQAVFERDEWICHICSLPVDRDEKVPHPGAPTLDHVVPLAAGGAHAPENVRTAHFLCNSTKGARLLEAAGHG